MITVTTWTLILVLGGGYTSQKIEGYPTYEFCATGAKAYFDHLPDSNYYNRGYCIPTVREK